MTDDQLQDIQLWRRILLWTHTEQGRGKRYSVLILSTMLAIWAPSLLYLKFSKPTFTSKWTLILPGTGVNSSINLENIGQAETSSVSAYGSHSISPNANYKNIAESSNVIEKASQKMGLSVDQFGKSRISLVDQTSMIFFEVNGGSGEEAQKKSYALYEALESTLQTLRLDEIKRREESVQNMLAGLKDKLKKSRDRLLEYQASSEVVEIEQYNQLTMSLEKVKIDLVELKAEQSRLIGERDQLAKVLNLTAEQASGALMLQTDQMFQENMVHYVQADSALATLILKMGENHPEVVKSRNQMIAAKQKITERVRQLIGNQDVALLNKLTLSTNQTRGALFEKLILVDSQAKGITDKIARLQQQIVEMTERFNKDTKSAATLDDLKRDHQIAEAVFTAALARIDTGKTDVYASYPLIQLLNPPNAPIKPTSPNRLFVFLGAGVATLICMFGMLVLWTRKPWLQKILLNG